jgi:hypothetical protein
MNFIALPKIFGDRLGLRRRLDDDDIHAVVPRFANASHIANGSQTATPRAGA